MLGGAPWPGVGRSSACGRSFGSHPGDACGHAVQPSPFHLLAAERTGALGRRGRWPVDASQADRSRWNALGWLRARFGSSGVRHRAHPAANALTRSPQFGQMCGFGFTLPPGSIHGLDTEARQVEAKRGPAQGKDSGDRRSTISRAAVPTPDGPKADTGARPEHHRATGGSATTNPKPASRPKRRLPGDGALNSLPQDLGMRAAATPDARPAARSRAAGNPRVTSRRFHRHGGASRDRPHRHREPWWLWPGD